MKNRKAYFGLALILLALMEFSGCGDDNLSADDAAWVHQQRLQQLYGSATATSTVVTITSVATETVTASTTTVY